MALTAEHQDHEPSSPHIARPAVLATEVLRGAAAAAGGTARAAPRGDRLSTFWRVFGTTLLSIAALVLITLYQQFTATISELRNDLNRLTEGRADLVKNEEFNSRMTSVWTSMKDLQSATAATSALKERAALMEQRVKDGQDQLNARITGLAQDLHEVQGVRDAVLALKERAALLEQRLQAAEEERKELTRELQALRERQAALEGRTAGAAGAPAEHAGK